MASVRNDRLAERSHDVVQLALYPAVDRQRFLDQARAEFDDASGGGHRLDAYSWRIDFAGEGGKQTAIVSGKLEGVSPFARGREHLLQLLSASGKHVSERAGRYECRFRLNYCDLEMSFDEAASRLFDEPVPSETECFFVVKESSLRISDETRVDLRLSVDHRGEAELGGIASSQSSSGILGALKSVICRLRPAYARVEDTPWSWKEFARFAHDFQGRFGWSKRTRCRRYERGFLFEIPAGRPFWLAAPNAESTELLTGEPVVSEHQLEHVGHLESRFRGDDVLENQVREGLFMVRKLPGGLFFEYAI